MPVITTLRMVIRMTIGMTIRTVLRVTVIMARKSVRMVVEGVLKCLSE